MSEKQRKKRWWLSVAAVVSAVALGIGGVAVPGAPVASAWNQQDIPGGFGEDPDENYMPKTTASFWQFEPETLKEDGSFTYTIQGSATAPKPKPEPDAPVEEQRGASDIKTMTVWVWAATPNTTLQEPTPEDFTWASGTTRPFKNIEKVAVEPGLISDADGNEIGGGDGYKIEFEINAPEDSFKADIQAQLKGDVPAGTQVTAANYVESAINPQVFWDVEEQRIDQDTENPDKCAGIASGKHRLQGGGYGQWMAEMYLGSLDGNLELRGAPRVTFTLPNGSRISGADSGMTQGDVNSEVLHKDYKRQFEETNTGTVWGQKFDWPFDEKTATGRFWLPTGTVFEFEQNVYDKSKPCSDKKWGGDKLHHRALLTSANPGIVKSDSAYTTFALPEGEEPCDCELGSVGDKVWVDMNKNGAQDEDETQGVPGVKVTLQDASGREIARTVTDEDGSWSINVKPGEYTVVYEPGNNVPSKAEQVERTVTIKPGEKRDDIDLGILPSGSVGDRVWNDEDGDGKQGDDEKGIPNVIVEVSREGEPTRTTYTDENGNWAVNDLTPDAEYEVRFIKPEGWEVTGKVPGSDESGLVSKVAVEPGGVDNSYDLGLKKTDVTCDCEPEEPGTIGDRVWVDENGDGKEDPDEKTGVPNVVVVIKDKDGNEVTRTVTDKDGNWKVDVEPGEYTVEYVPGGETPSDPSQIERTVTIKPGEKRDDVDLGVHSKGSVGDRVWNDEDGDGKQGEDEKGLENVVVLVSREGEPTRSAVTDANGDWKIEGLNPNTEYDIRFIKPEGWEVTGKVPGSDESGLVSKVTVKPGEYNDSYDLGLKKTDVTCDCEPEEPGTIGDRVWVDENGDGKEDPDEKTGVPNVVVVIKDKDGNEVTRTVTDENGNWKVDVEPGDYVVEYVPGENVPSQPDQVERAVTIKPGEKRDDIDLGILPSGSVGDRVWNDEDGDGKQGEDEKGLENVVVLVSREGEPTRSAVTDENGDWKMEGLNPNAEYDIRFIKPEGWEVTGKVPGSDESGLVSKVTVKPNEYNDTYDLGLKKTDVTCDCEPVKPGRIGDRVWIDLNGNGKQDPNETEGAPDVTVIVRDADGNEVTRTVTDEDGKWKVDVEPGDYEIEYRPRDWKPTDPKRLIQKITVEENGEHLDLDLGVQPKEPTLPEKEIVPTTVTKPVPTTVTKSTPTTVTKPVPTTVTKSTPTTVEKAVPTTVHNTTTAEAPKRGTIGDRVWEDTNGDGKEDPDEKTGIPNVPVVIVDKDGNEVTRTVTDKDGNWKVDVEPGEYTVRYETGDRTPSDPELVERTITVKPGEEDFDVDLGILPSGSVGDRVWNDADGDGKQSEDEKGLENVVVLVSRDGEPTRSAVTDENGDWKIEGLNPNAEYEVRFIKPEGWEVTGKVPDSDESGLVSKVTVKPNEYNDSYDLGLQKTDVTCDCEPVKPGTIGNRVWIDLNGNGKQDPNETEGAPDVTVIVRDADGNEVTRTVTDENGNWKVNVEPGDYEIEYRPRDWKPTDPKRVTQKVTVEEGKEYLDLDLGVQKPKPGEPTPPTDEPEPQPEQGSSTETLDRCVANAVRSPLLYLVPVALLGAFGGEIARPYMGAVNEQVNQINAQFQEAMRRNTPDWGQGGRGGRDNDQFAELRGQIDAANRRLAELGQDPNVQRFGTVAAGVIGLIAAGGVLYDWCSNEKGEAFTSIGGSSSKDAA